MKYTLFILFLPFVVLCHAGGDSPFEDDDVMRLGFQQDSLPPPTQDSAAFCPQQEMAGTSKVPAICIVWKVQNALRERGYDCPLTGKMCNRTKAALTKFQKDNGLTLPYSTGHYLLQALGIEREGG